MAPPSQQLNKATKNHGTVAQEIERSNSTTAAFLGGKQKAWMLGSSSLSSSSIERSHASRKTGNSLRNPREVSSVHGSKSLEAAHEVSSNENINKPSTLAVPSEFDRGRFPAQRRNTRNDKGTPRARYSKASGEASSSLTALPQQVKQYPKGNLANRHVEGENVLAPPSPSEDGNHEAVHSLAIEDPGRSSLANDETRTTRLKQLMAKYGSVGEIEKHFQLASSSNVTQVRPSTDGAFATPAQTHPILSNGAERTSTTPIQAPFGPPTGGSPSSVLSHKRGHETSVESRKRTQHQPQRSSDLLFWSSLSNAYARRIEGEDHEYERLMKGCSYAVAKRIEAVSSLGDRSDIERPRLDLLLEACNRFDHSYLLLHQYYCWTHAKANGPSMLRVGISEVHQKGLEALKRPLATNNELREEAIVWFSHFPGHLTMAIPGDDISSEPAQQWYSRILQTLAEVGAHWDELRATCSSRRMPPLVSEMLLMLQVDSVVLQQVMFRATLRDIFISPVDPCFTRHEDIFSRNQTHVMGDKSSTTRSQMRVNDDAGFANEHREVWVSHMSHVPRIHEAVTRPFALPIPTMAPPITHHRHTLGGTTSSRSRADDGFGDLPTNTHAAQRNAIANPSAALRSVSSASRTAPLPRIESPQSVSCCQHGPHQDHSHGASRPTSLPQYSINTQRTQNFNLLVNSVGRRSAIQGANELMHGNTGAVQPQVLAPAGTTFTTGTGDQLANTTVPSNLQASRDSGPGAPSPSNFQRWPTQLSRATSAGMLSHSQQQQSSPPAARFGTFPVQPQQTRNTAHGPQAPHFAQSLPQTSISDQFIRMPSPKSHYTVSAQANPSTTALHHARVLSPKITTGASEHAEEKCFRFIKAVYHPAEAVSQNMRYQEYVINLSRAETELLAKDASSVLGTPLTRHGPPGSFTFRIRCLKSKSGTPTPVEEEWVVSDHTWPSCLAVVFNEVALELRRKFHYGKDLPIDVTRMVKEGPNILTVAVLGLMEDSDEQYTIGLEAIQVISYTGVRNSIRVINWHQARQRILSKDIPTDPDIEVLQPEITVDLTDPFTTKIFEIPARGKNCRHDQCFDLETFLSTRISKEKKQNEPCSPDEFKCPICNGDVRPGNLVIDGFLLSLREKLQAQGQLEDTKAIVMDQHGEWRIKQEEEISGETGDGGGRCRTTGPQPMETKGKTGHPLLRHHEGTTRTVIELDED